MGFANGLIYSDLAFQFSTQDVLDLLGSKMLGHKNSPTPQHYAKILDRKVSDDMKVLTGKFVAQNKPVR